jgi:transcriptional regulator with XRE-family HTH domain
MNKPLPQQELAGVFVERLQAAMADRNINAAQLARETGLSKAAISQLLSAKKPRLPNSYSVYNLARALDRTVDYFLAPAPQGRGPRMPLAVDYYESLLDEPVWVNAGDQLSDTDFVIDICDTLPDFLKTEATLLVEYGDRPETHEYFRRMEAVRARFAERPFHGFVLCDAPVVFQLISGVGLYRALSAEERQNQIALMVDYFEDHFPTVSCIVIHFRHLELSPALLFGKINVITTAFGGHIHIASSELFESIRRKALFAARKGVPLQQYVDLVGNR